MTDHSRVDADGATHDDGVAAVEVQAERLVAGGAVLARRHDGRIVLVEGALPGERVVVSVEERKGTLRGTTLRVLDPSRDRIAPVCGHVADGCGGCDMATMDHGAQIGAKLEMLRDAFARLGHWSDPVLRPGPALPAWGFRTTLRVAVADGRAALRRAASHEVVPVPDCRIVHPLLAELVGDGWFADADEVTLRVAPGTGERLALVAPTAEGVELPDDVRIVGVDELRAGRRAWLHDEVAGRRWRISATSFFQTRADGAAALVEVVRTMVDDVVREGGPGVLLDAYCGVGLFSGSVLDGVDGWSGIAIERGRSSVADARVNLSDLDVRVIGAPVERRRAAPATVVVADPSRAGLGREGVEALAAAGAERFVLVSCDPAAAARDLALLGEVGYRPVESVVVDLFPHSHHVEAVTRLDR